MKGKNTVAAATGGSLKMVLLCIAALTLLFFIHTILVLKPIWNEMRNFVAAVTGIKLDWMNIFYWVSLMLVIFFGAYAVRAVVDRFRGRVTGGLGAAATAAAVAIALWNVLLAVIFQNTGRLFLAPAFRYEWDIAAPWVWLVAALAAAGFFTACLLRRDARTSRTGKSAWFPAAAAAAVLSIAFFVQSIDAFSVRSGLQSRCAGPRKEAVDFVNPLTGTRGGFEYGKTLPLVAAPFGMTHWTPMTRENMIGVHPYKYHHGDRINGFLGTHKPAVWMGDYGQVALMPGTGDVRVAREDRALAFTHADECATPYYYGVKLRAGWNRYIDAEMTATERCGYLRFIFPPGRDPHVVVEASRLVNSLDVAGGSPDKVAQVLSGWIRITAEKGEIAGYNTDRDSCSIGPTLPNFKGYFLIRFNRPMRKFGTWENRTLHPGRAEHSGDLAGAYAVFDAAGGKALEAKIGTSFVSLEQARENLDREIPAWNFGAVKERARSLWRQKLAAIDIEGATDEQKEVFYTAMYRCLLFPRIFSEYGRYYSAFDDRVHSGVSYNDYSLWDTFRALHPLLIFIAPERVPGMITALVQMYEEGGWMPKWPNPTYTNIMIGTHADSVVADAYVKGVRGFDAEKAYRAMRKNAMVPPDGDSEKTWGDRAPWTAYEARAGLTWYKKLGYIPSDKVVESVSCTLEYAYDDFCVAQMAKALGKGADYRLFMERSRYYKNLYNKATGFMSPRMPDGSWDPDPLKGFTEGDPWTYLFCAMQDVPGLMDVMGGREAFVKRLDENFDGGHYVHENEPGHHYVYLYDYAGEPWKAQEKARRYSAGKYGPGPGGLAGDEDCGQMSAWYIFSAMGFYPVAPGSDEYALGSPRFPKLTISLPGRKFEVIARNVSEKNKYIRSAVLNGRPLTRPFIRHGDIVGGSSLVFVMGDVPNYNWK